MLDSIGIVMIIIGLVAIFKPDVAWSFTEFSNQLNGVESKRTSMWDFSRIITGISLIVFGITFLIRGR